MHAQSCATTPRSAVRCAARVRPARRRRRRVAPWVLWRRPQSSTQLCAAQPAARSPSHPPYAPPANLAAAQRAGVQPDRGRGRARLQRRRQPGGAAGALPRAPPCRPSLTRPRARKPGRQRRRRPPVQTRLAPCGPGRHPARLERAVRPLQAQHLRTQHAHKQHLPRCLAAAPGVRQGDRQGAGERGGHAQAVGDRQAEHPDGRLGVFRGGWAACVSGTGLGGAVGRLRRCVACWGGAACAGGVGLWWRRQGACPSYAQAAPDPALAHTITRRPHTPHHTPHTTHPAGYGFS